MAEVRCAVVSAQGGRADTTQALFLRAVDTVHWLAPQRSDARTDRSKSTPAAGGGMCRGGSCSHGGTADVGVLGTPGNVVVTGVSSPHSVEPGADGGTVPSGSGTILTGNCVLLGGRALVMSGEERGVLDSTVATGVPVGAGVLASSPPDVLAVESASPASTVVESSATDEVVSSVGSASLLPTAPRG